MAVSDAVAHCRSLSLDYRSVAGSVRALREVDAGFERGRLAVVAGPSGSGKSSLLRVLMGLHRPTSGRVEVDGQDLTTPSPRRARSLRRRRMGIVLQSPAANLIDYLPAIEQVVLAARLRDVASEDAGDLLAAVGLTDRVDSYPHQLSGGEQQRVAFAAAAIGEPALLLADEPTAQLDAAAGAVLVDTMRHLVERGATLIVSSHDPAVVAAADSVLHLRNGEVHHP